MQYYGIVVDNIDEDALMRIKVRIFGKHTQHVNPDDKTSPFIIKDDDLPWAYPDNLNGSLSVPKIGNIVSCDVVDDYQIIYNGESLLADSLKTYFTSCMEDYLNQHVLIYDDNLGADIDENYKQSNNREGEYIKVYYLDSKGFMVDYKTTEGVNKININPKNDIEITNAKGAVIKLGFADEKITIESPNKIVINADDIKIGKKDGDTVKVLDGNRFLQEFCKHTHSTPAGPSGPPQPLPNTSELLLQNIELSK